MQYQLQIVSRKQIQNTVEPGGFTLVYFSTGFWSIFLKLDHCTVDDLGQIFDLLSALKLKSKNAPRDLKFNHNVAI